MLAKHLTEDDLLSLPHVLDDPLNDDAGLVGTSGAKTVREMLKEYILTMDDLMVETAIVSDEAVFQALNGYNRIEHGLEAVYTLISTVNRRDLVFKEAMDWDAIKNITSECGKVVGPSSQMNQKSWKAWFEDIDDGDNSKYWENAAEGFKHAQNLTKQRDLARESKIVDEIAELPDDKFVEYSPWKWLYKEGLFILCGTSTWSEIALILTNDDMEKCYKLSSCLANTFMYASDYYNRSKLEVNYLEDVINMILKTIDKVRGASVQKIAKAFHSVSTGLYAKLSESPELNQYEMLKEEHRADGLDAIFPFDGFNEIFDKVAIRTKLEIAKIYKMLPAPDFDITSSLASIKKYHDFPNPTGADISDVHEEYFNEFVASMRRNFIRTYRSIHGKNPGTIKPTVDRKPWHTAYLENKKMNVPVSDAFDIDLSNTLRYDTVKTEYYSLLEDKALAPHDFKYLAKPMGLTEAPMTERSTLHHLLFDKELLNTEVILKELEKPVTYNHVQIAWKAESHKPESRIFYMAPLRSRLALQENERNIRRQLKNKVGNFMGIDPVAKAKKMASLSNTIHRSSNTIGDVATYMISFDLSKFSTHFPERTKKVANAFFDEIFGVKHFSNSLQLVNGARIAMKKEGIAANYVNKGYDLEGMTGAQNTWIHIDAMATAIRIAARKGHCYAPAELGVFIDDGACKLDVPFQDAERHIIEALKIISEVYKAIGFEISLKKTFVSTKFSIFLNDVMYKGRPVTPGIKAFLRISPDFQNPAAAITEELGEIFSKCQGAVKAGCSWMLAYRKYIREAAKALYRWTRYGRDLRTMSATSIALLLYTPTSLGGLGIQGIQVLTTTLGSSAFVEGVAILEVCARYYKAVIPHVKKILGQALVQPTGIGFLRDPTRVRVAGPTIVQNRLTKYIIDYLTDQDINDRMKACLNAKIDESMDKLGREIMAKKYSSYPVISKIWAMSPMAFIEHIIGKFKRANSIISLLGFKKVGIVRTANKNDVRGIIDAFLISDATI